MEDKDKYFLQPGYIFASKRPHLISTVLGSCISVCIWDCSQDFGGMNHYIHAKPYRKEKSAQFGSISIPYMIKLLLDMGAVKHNLKAHVIGGAQNSLMKSSKIGDENIKIAENVLKKHYIDIVTMDTGGNMGRKVIFDSQTGEVVVYKVNNIRECDWNVAKSIDYR